MNERYAIQNKLPEMGPAQQEKLKNTKLVMIGAGGLGAAALPYLAGAGIGQITIIDHDVIARSNLHRQTIYQDKNIGAGKAEATAQYLRALNPNIEVAAIPEKLTATNAQKLCAGFDIILDGSDNFETKRLLNETAIALETPLISAGVEQFSATIGIFAGHLHNAPCYRCLFPEIPPAACNCSEAGILGTAAGIAGLYQAHMTLCFLLGLGPAPGTLITADLRNFRTQSIKLEKNPDCAACGDQKSEKESTPMNPVEIIPSAQVRANNALIIDVRTEEEIAGDPIEGAIHMRLDTIPERWRELPQDRPLAFACAANVRSMQAAQYVRAMGYEDVCVMDRLAG